MLVAELVGRLGVAGVVGVVEGVVVGGVVGCVGGVVVGGVVGVVAGGVAGIVAGIVAGEVAGTVAGIVAGAVLGSVAGAVVDVVPGTVAKPVEFNVGSVCISCLLPLVEDEDFLACMLQPLKSRHSAIIPATAFLKMPHVVRFDFNIIIRLPEIGIYFSVYYGIHNLSIL